MDTWGRNFEATDWLPSETPLSGWLGSVSRGLTMASGILGGVQSFQASGGLKDQARQYEQRAAQVLEEGFQSGMDIDREGKRFLGSMTAAFGKSGSLLEGSPLLALVDTEEAIQKDVERAIQQGRIEQAAYLEYARQLRKAARKKRLGGVLQIGAVAAAPFTGGASLGLTAAQWG